MAGIIEYELPDEFPPLPEKAVGGVWDLEDTKWVEFLFTDKDLWDAADGLDRAANLLHGHTVVVVDKDGEEVEPSGF